MWLCICGALKRHNLVDFRNLKFTAKYWNRVATQTSSCTSTPEEIEVFIELKCMYNLRGVDVGHTYRYHYRRRMCTNSEPWVRKHVDRIAHDTIIASSISCTSPVEWHGQSHVSSHYIAHFFFFISSRFCGLCFCLFSMFAVSICSVVPRMAKMCHFQ